MTLYDIKLRARRNRLERERPMRWMVGFTLLVGALLSIVMPRIEMSKTIEWSLFFAALACLASVTMWTWRTAIASRQQYEDEIDLAIVDETILAERIAKHVNPCREVSVSGEELERRLKEMN